MKLIMVRPKIEEKKEGRKEDYFFASESIFPKQTEKRKKTENRTEQGHNSIGSPSLGPRRRPFACTTSEKRSQGTEEEEEKRKEERKE